MLTHRLEPPYIPPYLPSTYSIASHRPIRDTPCNVIYVTEASGNLIRHFGKRQAKRRSLYSQGTPPPPALCRPGSREPENFPTCPRPEPLRPAVGRLARSWVRPPRPRGSGSNSGPAYARPRPARPALPAPCSRPRMRPVRGPLSSLATIPRPPLSAPLSAPCNCSPHALTPRSIRTGLCLIRARTWRNQHVTITS